LLIFSAAGMGQTPQQPTTMQTIQCPRCRHVFLSYAAECPECGLKRPRDTRSKWGPRAAVIISGIALGAAALMVEYIIHQDDEPPLRARTTVQAAAHTAAQMTAPAIAQTTAKSR
jgi:ribosomal protein L37E